MYPGVLRKHVNAKPLSFMFRQLGQTGEVSTGWKRGCLELLSYSKGKGRHPERLWQAWEVGLCEPQKVSEGKKAKSCIWLRTITNIDSHWAKRRLTAALSRRTWGYWWIKNWIWACDVHSQPRKPATSWVASKAAWPTGWEDVILPFCSSYEILTWSSASSSRVPNIRNM